jgi:hypothetical protein
MSDLDQRFKSSMTIPVKADSSLLGLKTLALRVGVEPGEGDGDIWLETSNGDRYDAFLLLNKFLILLDIATLQSNKE